MTPFKMLLSYHYYRDHDLDALVARFPSPPAVFADSGAFSAKSLGADVTLDGYCAWVERWEHLFDAYVSLDVIGDAKASWVNYRKMVDRGLEPMPVFHGGEPWDYLERYAAAQPYIALGGMVATGGLRAVMGWLVRAFRIAADHGAVFHGFGQTKQEVLRAFPFYSADSSSWGSGHRWGNVQVWEPLAQRFVSVKTGSPDVWAHADVLRDHGGDPAHLAVKGVGLASVRGTEQARLDRHTLMSVSVNAWLRYEAYLRRRHGTIPRPGAPNAAPGPHIYLAEGSADHLVAAAHIAARTQETAR